MMKKIFIKLYDLVWYFCLPFILLYLYRRGYQARAYRQRWSERLGWQLGRQTPVDLWFHAVSLGEVVAVTPLIEACLKRGYSILVTCMTPTGSAQIQRSFGERVLHQYFPYDLGFARQRFLQTYQPKLWVIVETELWPGWLWSCQQQGIPVVLVNGRISQRSYPRYLATQRFWRVLLNYFSAIYVQSETDKARFIRLGANPQQLYVAGNLKFHPQHLGDKIANWHRLKQSYPHAKFVVFASTHAGEEEKILPVWLSFQAQHPDWISIWLPRHPERFAEVYRLLNSQLSDVVLSSQWSAGKALNALLVDQMGELAAIYAIADLAFVGGSLVPIGGHNILEPMVFGLPVMTGPYMHNQQDLLRLAREHEVLVVVKDEMALLAEMLGLAEREQDRQVLKAKTKSFFEQNQQALAICLQGIETLMKQPKG